MRQMPPEKVLSIVYNQNGIEVHKVHLRQKPGTGEVEIDTRKFESGLYAYTLVLNGKTVDSKTMIVSK